MRSERKLFFFDGKNEVVSYYIDKENTAALLTIDFLGNVCYFLKLKTVVRNFHILNFNGNLLQINKSNVNHKVLNCFENKHLLIALILSKI